MKNILNKEQYLGLFVLLTIICIFLTINFLRGVDLFSGHTKYYTTFNSVEGLTAKSPIYIMGLKVGAIDKITYNKSKGDFTISMTVKSDYAIPQDSKAELYSSDILGSKSVRIAMGQSNIHTKKNDTLAGVIIPDMVSLLTSEIQPIKEQLSSVMANLNTTLTSINTVLDSTGQKNLAETFENLNSTAANASRLTANLNKMTPAAEELVANLSELSQALKDNKGSIEKSLSNIETLSGNLAQAQIKETIENLNELLSKLQSPDGTVGQILNSNKIYNNIDSLISNIDNLVQKITENPKKYIKISVF